MAGGRAALKPPRQHRRSSIMVRSSGLQSQTALDKSSPPTWTRITRTAEGGLVWPEGTLGGMLANREETIINTRLRQKEPQLPDVVEQLHTTRQCAGK